MLCFLLYGNGPIRMMAFGFFSRYVDGDHFTRFGDGEDFRQQRIVTALDRKADFLHRFADTHEQTDRFAVCRSADMLGNTGADFVDSFDFYVSYVFRQLFLSLEGRIFAYDFSFSDTKSTRSWTWTTLPAAKMLLRYGIKLLDLLKQT